MIETLFLRNFKVLRSVTVLLQPLTLVVGPNGSGKSSLLEALDWGLRFFAKGHHSRRLVPSDLKSLGLPGKLRLKISATVRRHSWELSITEPGSVQFAGDRDAFDEGFPPAVLNLDLKKLAAPSPAREIIETLQADGSGLASILAGLHLEAHAQFNEIVDHLRAVVPTVKGLRIRKTVVETKEAGYELLFDMKAGEGIPAQFVSEGTLMTLALLALLAGPNPPGLVLIENLERGLHPKALQDLVSQIRSLQKQDPSLQVVATSHSPYLLDYLEADEVLLTSLDEDGYASVRALSDHPEYDRWKGVMAPGEFWSTVGEAWVVQK
jgi:predicted ATPase